MGVAMGASGSDVARESADLVLLDDHFATIVRAIEQGRATFQNVKRFLTYHLTDNVAELAPFALWALTGGSFPLAIGVLQVLALDIGTDMLPALALGREPPGISVTLSRSTIWPIASRCAATSIRTGFSPRSTRMRPTCEPISPAPITNVVDVFLLVVLCSHSGRAKGSSLRSAPE